MTTLASADGVASSSLPALSATVCSVGRASAEVERGGAIGDTGAAIDLQMAQAFCAVVGEQLYRRIAKFAAALVGIGLASVWYPGSVAAVHPRSWCQSRSRRRARLLVGSRLLYIRSVSQELCNTSNGQHVAAPASPLQQLHRPIPLSRASSARSDSDDFGRYQFQVVAANITDAVMSIGGLIFDRAMAGWDVSVVVDGGSDCGIDDRPIRILGGRVATRLEDRVGPPARPHMLAVATD